ncbi:MAG: hypothetical protein K6G48_07475 [Acholeplasmatales bacterium]|nr:hypothetical protein [Acholeplasmatales bacterium]
MSKLLQTSESNDKTYLKTHWYKGNYKMIKQAVLKVLSDCGFVPESTDDNYGEIVIENKTFIMTITIFEFTYAETAVDITYESKRVFDFGASKKDILLFYSKLGEYAQFKGLGLHP